MFHQSDSDGRICGASKCGLSVAKRYGIHPTCRPTARAAAGPGPALGPRGPDDGALPSLSEIQCSNTPTLRHVPARARYAWAPRACAAAAEYNDERAWVHLLMLPQPVLCAPPRGGRKPLLLLPWSASRGGKMASGPHCGPAASVSPATSPAADRGPKARLCDWLGPGGFRQEGLHCLAVSGTL